MLSHKTQSSQKRALFEGIFSAFPYTPKIQAQRVLIAFSLTGLLWGSLYCPIALADPNYEMGLKTYQLGEYELSSNYFRQALANDNANPNLRYYLADSLMKANRFTEAQSEYQKILSLAPGSQAAKLSRIALANLRTYVNSTGHFSNIQQMNRSSGLSLGDSLQNVYPKGADYLAEVSDTGKYTRWSLQKMPLKVWVQKNPDPKTVSNFEPAFVESVTKAYGVWSKATQGQISFIKTEKVDEAQIKVYWTNSIDKHGFVKGGTRSYTAGLTTPTIVKDQLRSMKVQIGTLDVAGRPQTEPELYTTIIHEFGHALGLMGHSSDKADIMYPQHNGSDSLSQRDLNTLWRLYQMPADVSNNPPDADAKKDKGKQIGLQNKLDATIADMERQVKTEGNSLNYTNLSVYYIKKADLIATRSYTFKEGTPEAEKNKDFWYTKAINALDTASKQEPESANIYSRKANIYIYAGQWEPALSNIDAAIRFEATNAAHHFTRSKVLAAMGKSAEALNALNQSRALDKAGDYKDASDTLEKLIREGGPVTR